MLMIALTREWHEAVVTAHPLGKTEMAHFKVVTEKSEAK